MSQPCHAICPNQLLISSFATAS